MCQRRSLRKPESFVAFQLDTGRQLARESSRILELAEDSHFIQDSQGFLAPCIAAILFPGKDSAFEEDDAERWILSF